MRILVDSDIIIDVLRGHKPTIELLDSLAKQNNLYISGITEAEVHSGKDMEDESRRNITHALIVQFNKINPDNNILILAGSIRRQTGMTLADCIIAATAKSIVASLLTKNRKDFERVQDLSLFNPTQ